MSWKTLVVSVAAALVAVAVANRVAPLRKIIGT